VNATRVALDSNTLTSGLLFPGNERTLLVRGVTGQVTLVVAEDAVDEVLRVLSERFPEHPEFGEAMAWLQRLLLLFERTPKSEYRHRIRAAAERIRDPKDAPILASALEADVDYLVSGDEDLLVLESMGRVKIRRTRDILSMLE